MSPPFGVHKHAVILHHPSQDYVRVTEADRSNVSGLIFRMASRYDDARTDSPYEAYQIVDVIGEGHEAVLDRPTGIKTFPVAEFRPVRTTGLVLTNNPDFTFGEIINVERSRIICRTRISRFYRDDAHCKRSKPYQEIWQNLPASECTANRSRKDLDLRTERRSDQLRVDGDGGPRRWPLKYTGCDLFCGAGFASEGMQRAGIDVALALDMDENVLSSYKVNHPHTDIRMQDVMLWLDRYEQTSKHLRVDILQISFPCQFFSGANTRNGMATNDGVNEAAWFSLGTILQKIKPRVVCIEQTKNIVEATRHRQHHEHSIRVFREHGYSVQWKKINFASLGLCTTRKRIIYVAVARGDTLPPFPLENHNVSRPGSATLLPAVTVAKALEDVNPRHVNHNIVAAQRTDRGLPINVPAWDPRTTLIGTLCCGQTNAVGGQHFSGTRRWTPHELMLISGSTPEYRLEGSFSQCHKQIGNAFPSLAAEKIYQAIVAHLRQTDRADREELARLRQ